MTAKTRVRPDHTGRTPVRHERGGSFMRQNLTGLVSGLLLSAISADPVYAQTPPEQIRDYPGLTYLGQIGGLEAWSVEGSDALWMRAPDGRGLIRGDMFSAAGIDLGAALTGSDPSSPEEGLGVDGPDWTDPTPELISSVIRLSREEAFALRIGYDSAPRVWMWADLSDPATPATYMMLRELIEADEISLRVIPVVTGDPASSELMLRAISRPGPIGALEDLVRGAPLPEGWVIDEERLSISDGLISRVERNGQLASRVSPPGLPFLVWEGANGPAAFRGIPRAELFRSTYPLKPQEDEAGSDASDQD